MKILVVNLLRIGDLITTTSVLKGLKAKYPDCELHMLVNRDVEVATSLIPCVDRWHYFERTELQDGLAKVDHALFEPFHALERLIKSLEVHKFDELINLTHNKLSGWVCAAINAKNKHGLVLGAKGAPSFGSPWFRYLNDQCTKASFSSLHTIDVFSYAVGVPRSSLFLKSTPEGQAEAEALISQEPFVVVQPFTSEWEKNWGVDNYAQALEVFAKANPKLPVLILGAPFEKERVKKLENLCVQRGVKAQAAICSLEGAFSILQRASVLLTGDTAIKHMAAATDCRVLELSLGSSDLARLGSYQDNSLIVQANEPCAPCSHHKGCHRKTHACANRLLPDVVGLALDKFLHNDWASLSHLGNAYRDQMHFFKVENTRSGYWDLRPLCMDHEAQVLRRALARSAWKMYLENADKLLIGEFGSEALFICDRVGSTMKRKTWEMVVKDLNRDLEQKEADLIEAKRALSRPNACLENPNWLFGEQLLMFKEDDPTIEDIRVSNLNAFTKTRKVQIIIDGIERRINIQKRLLKAVRCENMEQL